MNSSIQNPTMTATAELSTEKLEAQVTQLWGDNVIAQKHATEGALTLAVAEGDIEIARWVSGALVVTPPGSTSFVLRAGHSVDVAHRDMIFRVTVSTREERPRRNLAAAILEDSTLRTVAGSGVMHAALLAAFAFFMPAMSSADDTMIDRDRMLQLQHYMTAAAEREMPQQDAQGDGAAQGGDSSGPKAMGEEGKTGGPTQSVTHARMTLRGDAQPEDAKMARDRMLKEAADFGMIGLIAASAQSDPNAPVVPWGNVAIGSDRESHFGDMFSGDPGDVFGTGFGLSGDGEGGGGSGQGIGLGGIGGLGSCTAVDCTGGHGGVGHGHGPNVGGHVPHAMPMRFVDGHVTSNGRLDPAVIQRIVRQNQGRFIGCYQQGLQQNPSLAGRVAVRFVIGREGDVQIAQDTSGSDLPDTNVRACVVKAFYGVSFPEPAGGIVNVNYPLVFTPAE